MLDIPEALRRPGPRQDHLDAGRRGEDALNGSWSVTFGAPHRHRHAAHRLVRHRRRRRRSTCPKLATGEMVAAYALTEPGSGSRRARREDQGGEESADGKSLGAQRQQAVHHQRRLRRRVHRLRQGRRRASSPASSSSGARPASPSAPRSTRWASAARSTCPLFFEDAQRPGREPARGDRQGPQDRLQHPQPRPAEARRRRARRDEAPARERAAVRARSASSSRRRSASSR